MKNFFLILFLAICSSAALAADTVRLKPDTDLAVNAFTNKTFALNVTEPSGDATSDSAPAVVYVPMDGPLVGADEEENYFLDSRSGDVTNLFNTTDAAKVIQFPLYINVGASDKYLYVAVKEGSNSYKVAKQFSLTPYNGATNVSEIFPVSVKSLCDQTLDCANFTTISGTEKSYKAYFFLSGTTGMALGTTIDPSTNTGGIFFEVNLSNRVYTAAQVTPVISQIRKGDGRLIVTYTASASILKPKAVRVYLHGGAAPGPTVSPIGAYSAGNLEATEYAYSASGELTVSGLANDGNPVFLSVLYVDNYKFASVLSDDANETPTSIEELLKKQACFLLTAGFGEEHFIIDYFRKFRDSILAQSYLGKKFIGVYYELAPKYAIIVYKNETLRTLIRGAAYSLYFLFNYLGQILIFSALGAILLLVIYKKREKIKV